MYGDSTESRETYYLIKELSMSNVIKILSTPNLSDSLPLEVKNTLRDYIKVYAETSALRMKHDMELYEEQINKNK